MEIQYWVEVSGCLEYYFKKHNGITISNSFAPDILGIDSSCIVLEDNDECHYERAYSLEEIKGFIKESGMEFVAAYDAFTFDDVKADSERIYVIAREKGK